MSQPPTYLDRLQDELMAAGHRLQRPREQSARRRRSPRRPAALAIAAAGVTAAAAALALVLTITGQPAGTQAAYAGWTASPTAPAGGQIAAAQAACRAHFAKIDEMERHAHGTVEGGGQPIGSAPNESQAVQTPRIAPGQWRTVLSDTRGPYTMLIFEADEGHTKQTCLTNSAGSLFYASGSYEPHPAPAPAGGIGIFYQGVTGRADPYTYIDGQTGAGVTGVTVELADGTQVQATVMGGWYLAWWPGSEKALSAQVSTAQGATSTRSLAQ